MALQDNLLNVLLRAEFIKRMERSESWVIKDAVDYNDGVDNTGNYINLRELGLLPDVVRGNQPLPYGVVHVNDNILPFPLETYRIPPVRLGTLEDMETSGKKRAKLVEDLYKKVLAGIYDDGVYNIAPVQNTAETPVKASTGTVVGGLKIISEDDIWQHGSDLTDAGFPDAGRRLVINYRMFYELIKTNTELKKRFANIGNLENFSFDAYGFTIIVSSKTAYYDGGGEKLPFGTSPVVGTDRAAAHSYIAKESYGMGIGSLTSDVIKSSGMYGSTFEFECKAGITTLGQKRIGAIYQGA